MGNGSSKKRASNKSGGGGGINLENIRQLKKFGYSEAEIFAAMEQVNNPNDINQVYDCLEEKKRRRQMQEMQAAKQKQEMQVAKYNHQPNNNNNNNDNDDEKGADAFLAMLQGLVSLAVVEQHGFIVATEAHRLALIKALANVNPMGGTALRDSVMAGVVLLLKLKGVLLELGAIKHKFVHIVLTDGADTSSECSLFDMKVLFLKLGAELGSVCKTFFIGVGLAGKDKLELEQIAALGGEAADCFTCEDASLDKVFDRINVELGIRQRIIAAKHGNAVMIAESNQLVASITENKFLVLFTLDKSGSMSGSRWNKVVRAVAAFCIGMKDSDILGCILFNDKAQLITD